MPVITYRDALNQALREEMQRDDRVFIMGEEVGVYQGAYKVSKGMLQEFGEMRVVDTPITELGFAGVRPQSHGQQRDLTALNSQIPEMSESWAG